MLARIRRVRETADTGIGMLAVIIVAAIITALVATVSFVTVNNIDNTDRDRHALSALEAAEGGVAQALQYLRGAHLASITCDAASPSGAGCDSTTPSWTSAANPRIVTMDPSSGATTCDGSEACAKVWIGRIQAYESVCPAREIDSTAACVGLYRIHSTGYSGGGPAARAVEVDVEVQPYAFPLGVYAKLSADFAGDIRVYGQSFFSGGTIVDRRKVTFGDEGETADLFYGGTAGARAKEAIGNGNGNGNGGGGSADIHEDGCSPDYPYDLSGSPGAGDCALNPELFGAWDLTDDQYEELKAQAKAHGTYNVAPAELATVMERNWLAGISTPVLYWDQPTQAGEVRLQASDIPSRWTRVPGEEEPNTAPGCTKPNAIIVVRPTAGSLDLNMQSGSGGGGGAVPPMLVAAVFVPDGTIKMASGMPLLGTVMANTLDVRGTAEFRMDQCFVNNPPGGVLDVKTSDWREADSEDVN